MTTGPTLNFDQIQSLWVQAGGNPAWAPLAAAIAMAESGGNTTALNNNPNTGDYSVGLWQINYFGGLLQSREQQFGAPASLQASPAAQASAAVALSNNGTNWQPWQGDAAYQAWTAHGAPAAPTKATLGGWGVSFGGAGGSSTTVSTATAGGAVAGGSGTGCGAKGDIFSWSLPGSSIPVVGALARAGSITFTKCQGKALVSGILIGFGGALMVTGTLIVVAWGLGHTRGGQAATRAARAVPGVKRATKSSAPARASSGLSTTGGEAGDRDSAYYEGVKAGLDAAPAASRAATQGEANRESRGTAKRLGVVVDAPPQGTGAATRPRRGTSTPADRAEWAAF